MKILFLKDEFRYAGDELRSLYLYEKGLKGDGVLSWIGPCDVSIDSMVDAEDRVNKDFISSEKMVHFLAEFFHKDIFYGIFIQRLLAENIKNYLNEKTKSKFIRKGDDVYLGNKKLNVSIATVTPLSTIVHVGVNVSSKNTPVPTVGLDDLKIDAESFSKEMMNLLKVEVDQVQDASVKVFSR